MFQCLPLAFVDGHSKAGPDWKLDPFEVKSKSSWAEWNSWNENIFTSMVTTNDSGLYDMILEFHHHQSGSIT